jgi:hypothetical protein
MCYVNSFAGKMREIWRVVDLNKRFKLLGNGFVTVCSVFCIFGYLVCRFFYLIKFSVPTNLCFIYFLLTKVDFEK